MSAIPVNEVDSVVAELPQPKGPGARLKAAREAKGLTVDAAAEAVRIKPDVMLALEADDFDRLPARVYVTGYLKKYARFLNIPEAAMVKALNDFSPVKEQSVKSVVSRDVERNTAPISHGHDRGFPFLKIFLILALLAGGYYVWQSKMLDDFDISMPEVTGLQSFTDVFQQPLDNASDAQLSLPPAQPMLDISTDVSTETSESSLPLPIQSQADLIESTEPSAPAVEEIIKPEPVAETAEISDLAESTEQPVIEETNAVTETISQPQAVAENAVEAVAEAEVVLTFDQVCWADIRDSAKTFKYINQAPAGKVLTLEGTPPYKILLGNAEGVRMTVNGKAFDLSAHTNANVARFVLNPAEY